MKKSILLFLVAVLVIISAIPAFAYRIGDVIGSSLTTDIVAQINGYDIASYNYQGYTYVIAEDLANYGFSVSYDNSSRTLSLYRNNGVSQIYSTYKKPAVSSKDVGKKAFNLLYTDIKTYIDGRYVDSYNINGQTIIAFDELSGYGSYIWDNNTRKITLDMPGIEKRGVGINELPNTKVMLKEKFDRKDLYGNSYPIAYAQHYGQTEVILNGQFSRFTATAFIDGSNSYPRGGYIKIYADNKLIFETNMSNSDAPLNINVNVSGCSVFKMSAPNGAVDSDILFYNPCFK